MALGEEDPGAENQSPCLPQRPCGAGLKRTGGWLSTHTCMGHRLAQMGGSRLGITGHPCGSVLVLCELRQTPYTKKGAFVLYFWRVSGWRKAIGLSTLGWVCLYHFSSIKYL